MLFTVIICAVTVAAMIFCILRVPPLRIGKFKLDSYCLAVLAGALILMLSGQVRPDKILKEISADTAVNPIKILVLFISMTVLSVFLDEVGFFRCLAAKTLRRAGGSQMKLFVYLYIIVSVLTVFTSNDIIILTFTPFICYFAQSADIRPVPYLIAEFIAANTWSMALIIGNPTNIYLASSAGIRFFDYLKVMLLPTLLAGTVAFLVLFLLFRKQLREPIQTRSLSGKGQNEGISDIPYLVLGLTLLGVCTGMMAFSSFLGVEMWSVSLSCGLLLFAVALLMALFRKKKPVELLHTLKRAPWQMIIFVLSMFVLVLALKEKGASEAVAEQLNGSNSLWKYGIASFLACNVINNIPMSVFFSSVLGAGSETAVLDVQAVFATVAGSNIGAFLTPVGALAGIMWSDMLKSKGVRFGYLSFVRYGVVIAFPTMLAVLFALSL